MDEKLNGSLTSLSDTKTTAALSIYPNPASQYINIVGTDSNIFKISIVSLDGKIIQQTDYHNDPVYVGNINPGLYFMQIEMSDKINITKEIIIVR
jgi:hypothetical protein